MPKQRRKAETPTKHKKYVQYGVAALFIGGGLYLNLSGNDSTPIEDEPLTPTIAQLPSLPTSETPDEEPSDRSLLAPVSAASNNNAAPEQDMEVDNQEGATSPVQAGATLDEYNPTRLWLDPEDSSISTQSAETNTDPAISPTPELGELGEFEGANTTQPSVNDGELPPTIDDASEASQAQSDNPDQALASGQTIDPEGQAYANTGSDLSNDIERLALNRQRIEQRVRRGQIPPTQREEILRSEEFNSVIASIGRRVGETWYYEGEDHDAHGAILGIELGEDGTANDIRIRRSSGNSAFNSSVLEAAHSSAPFVEVTQLSSTAQTLLNPFSLTFGSMEAIEAFESTWAPQVSSTASATDTVGDPIEHRTVSMVKREMQNHWPSDFETGTDHDISMQVTLAVPLGNVASVDFLRGSNNVDVNDRIYQLLRSMPAFSIVRGLSLEEQQAVRQFNLHVTPAGVLR